MILFDGIPNNWLVPGNYTETSDRRAGASTIALPRRVLVVGQRLSSGLIAAGTPHRIQSDGDAEYAHGTGSMLAEMCRVMKARNPNVEMWSIGLADDGAGVAASATFTFGGTSTAAGSFVGYVSPYRVGAELRGQYKVAVAASTAAATLATNWAAVVNADPYRQVNAVAVGAVVTCTSRHAGLLGNSLTGWHSYFDGEALPAGITCVITAFTTGATNPSISSAIAAMGSAHTTHLVHPYTDANNMTAVETEMTRRWGGLIQTECYAFTGARGSLSTLTTLGDTRNSQFQSIFGAGLSPTPPWIAGAEVAAIDAGKNHPGVPLKGDAINCMLAPRAGTEFPPDERQQLLSEGITTFTVDPSGKCMIDRLVSTYQVNTLGSPDSKYRDRQVVGLLFAIRWDWRTFLGSKYQQHMHAADGSEYAAGLPVVTPATIKAEFAGRALNVWQYQQAWIENAASFADQIVIERTEDGMDMVGVPDLINRLHITRTRFDWLR